VTREVRMKMTGMIGPSGDVSEPLGFRLEFTVFPYILMHNPRPNSLIVLYIDMGGVCGHHGCYRKHVRRSIGQVVKSRRQHEV
jgi:hypothetical protein